MGARVSEQTIAVPDQPDGIEEDSHDLPDPQRAAERVSEFVSEYGDGRIYPEVAPEYVDKMPPLYARDLEALSRAATASPATERRAGAVDRDQLIAAIRADLDAQADAVNPEGPSAVERCVEIVQDTPPGAVDGEDDGDAIDERDEAEAWADRLAEAIAPVEVIGEHSSGNNPWANALDHAGRQAAELAEYKRDATQWRMERDALQARLDQISALTDVRPRTVCICGSMRFQDAMLEAAINESLAGRKVLMPHVNMKLQDHRWETEGQQERIKRMLDHLHLDKVNSADEVLIINPDGYVGDSTRREIEHAEKLGKPVRYLVAPEATR